MVGPHILASWWSWKAWKFTKRKEETQIWKDGADLLNLETKIKKERKLETLQWELTS